MSIPLMALVWTSTMTDATEVAVLSCLASHANDEGESCFAGIPRIAKLVRRSERTVQRTIDALEKAGWLTVRRGDGAGNLTQYGINVEKLQGCQDVTLLKKGKRVTLAPEKGDTSGMLLLEGNVLETKASVNTPQPPQAGASELQASPDRTIDEVRIDEVLNRMANRLGVSARRGKRRLRDALADRVGLGEPLGEVADRMIAMYEKQAVNSRLLFRVVPLLEFIETGLWLDMNRWNWDQAAVREQRLDVEARTGTR